MAESLVEGRNRIFQSERNCPSSFSAKAGVISAITHSPMTNCPSDWASFNAVSEASDHRASGCRASLPAYRGSCCGARVPLPENDRRPSSARTASRQASRLMPAPSERRSSRDAVRPRAFSAPSGRKTVLCPPLDVAGKPVGVLSSGCDVPIRRPQRSLRIHGASWSQGPPFSRDQTSVMPGMRCVMESPGMLFHPQKVCL